MNHLGEKGCFPAKMQKMRTLVLCNLLIPIQSRHTNPEVQREIFYAACSTFPSYSLVAKVGMPRRPPRHAS